MTKETLKEKVIPITIVAGILLSGWALSTGSIVAHIGVPVFTYSAGAALGALKNGKFNWKDGLLWGALGAAFSIATALS